MTATTTTTTTAAVSLQQQQKDNTRLEVESIIDEKYITKEDFSKQIEKIVIMTNGDISFIEAAVCVADYHSIDIEDAGKRLITDRVKSKIQTEALKDNLVDSSVRSTDDLSLNGFFSV